MLAYLMRKASYAPPTANAKPLREPDLAPLRTLIDANPERRWSLRRLAEVSGYSRFHLVRAFQKRFHQTPHQYVMRRRIDRARQLLADTDSSVTRIALEVGFESAGAFSNRFKELVGWPPSAYRGRVWDQRAHPQRYIPGCHIETYGLKEQFLTSAADAPRVSSI